MAAERADIGSKGKAGKISLRRSGHMRLRPLIGDVGKLFLMRTVRATTTMLVVSRDCRIVVSGDARDSPFVKQLDYFVGPRRVAGQIAKVINGVRVLSFIDVRQHGL